MARKWWKYIIDPTGMGERVVNGWKNFFSGSSFLDSFYGDSNSLGDVIDDFGDVTNRVSGDYGMIDYQDAIADENATVAFDRQKELMGLEAQYNSPVYKSAELAKAGLNPALASGVSNSVGGASAQMAHPNTGQGSMLNMIGTLSNLSLLPEQKRGMKLDNDMKEQLLYEQKDSYGMRFMEIYFRAMGYGEGAQESLSHSWNLDADTDLKEYELKWNQMTENDRKQALKSSNAEKWSIVALNKAQEKVSKLSAEEQAFQVERMRRYMELYADDDMRAEVEMKLAEVKDKNHGVVRKDVEFGIMAACLVGAGICALVPGAQGVSVVLLKIAGVSGVARVSEEVVDKNKGK